MPTHPDPNQGWVGVTIADRYRIISRLASGGMADTWRAWDAWSGVPVVIKVPRPVLLEDPRFTQRFQREIRVLRQLRHAHIVPIIDAGVYEGRPFVVMQFLSGGTLADRRCRDKSGKPAPNPPGMLHLWLPAVAEALDYAHAHGIVHRDVKPANIFFDAVWTAYLGDFGIAKIVAESGMPDDDDLTRTQMGIGTPDYMAPEQFDPHQPIDGRADQYALAVIVYEMIAGVRPFDGQVTGLIVQVLTRPAPSLAAFDASLPAALVAAVDRGLAKRPGERFPSCRAFAASALAEVSELTDEPKVARFLCPKCSSMLVLPMNAGGKTGSCPKCRSVMAVAKDRSSLWLLDEAGPPQHHAAPDLNDQPGRVFLDEGVADIFSAPHEPRSRWRGGWLGTFLRRFGINS